MGRIYKRTPGSRVYGNFSESQVEEALKDVIDNNMSLRKAATKHKLAYGTLYNKFHGLRIKKSGAQTVFTQAEEVAFLSALIKCASWGFPLTSLDLRMFVKSFLDEQGRECTKFKDNLPGKDWVRGVLQRHKNFAGLRLASNITVSRASVSPEIVIRYFDNLKETLATGNVPPANVFNYDETNVSDDPGKSLVIYRRGTKYPEKICSHSKSSTTIMMCGSATGDLLPPYIIYKSQHLQKLWLENGPKGHPCCTSPCCASGACYNRTSHGWIDMATFTDWFESSFLPHARRFDGVKVLIGDNLASHFSPEVIRLCETNNIKFVCMPPNATNLCQPLDVAFFRPMKMAWRKTLDKYKATHGNTGLPKRDFPSLLAKALKTLDGVPPKSEQQEKSGVKRNLIAGFSACGLVPFNPQRVLQKLPKESEETEDHVMLQNKINDSQTEFLKKKRYGDEASVPRRRGKRLMVEPGKSVSVEISDEDEVSIIEESEDDQIASESEEELPVQDCELPDGNSNAKEGSFVLVKFLGGSRKKTEFRFVCIVQEVLDEGEVKVMGMRKIGDSRKVFRAEEDDVSVVAVKDILLVLPVPSIAGGDRLKYTFPTNINVKEL